MAKIICILISFVLCGCANVMHSADKRITALLTVNKAGELVYTLHRDNTMICDTSILGISIDGVALYKGVEIMGCKESQINESYGVRAVHDTAVNRCNEYTWRVRHKSSQQEYDVVMRLYDNGMAYRIVLDKDKNSHIDAEVAQWRLPQNSRVWFAERNSSWKLLTYAGEWMSTRADSLHSISSQGDIQVMPLIYDLDDCQIYVAVCEAALYNYSGMRLRVAADGSLNANFTEADGFDLTGCVVTPWRVTIIADGLNELVNNDMLTNLSPQPDAELFADVSWIKPGCSLWSWWSGIDGRYMDEQAEKEVIDVAASLGYAYTTIDEGWEEKDDKWAVLDRLTDYAGARKVGVLVWQHWSKINNPADNYAQMRCFLDSVAMNGVKGVKVDFMNGEGKRQIDFTTNLLQQTSKRKLVVNFHGCQKPSGESRTYPNELSREAVRGIELNRITANYEQRMRDQGAGLAKKAGLAKRAHKPGDENQNISASHNAALPFTRCILGAADYTPIAFSNRGNTTLMHQMATALLITSPLQTIAENPFLLHKDKQLSPLLAILSHMPTIWNQTIVLPQSKIGEVAAMARRCGNTWYVAVLNTRPQQLQIDLSFLADKKHSFTKYDDSIDGIKVSVGTTDNSASLNIDTQKNGGCVVVINNL